MTGGYGVRPRGSDTIRERPMTIPSKIYREEHELFRKTVSAFIEAEIAPHYERWEKEGQVSREVWRKAGEAGRLLTDIPVEYGGGGAGLLVRGRRVEGGGRA